MRVTAKHMIALLRAKAGTFVVRCGLRIALGPRGKLGTVTYKIGDAPEVKVP